MTVTYSERMKTGSTTPGSASNPVNYSLDGRGVLCSSGQPIISGDLPNPDNGQQVFHILCSAGGFWASQGAHIVTITNVQDASGEVINPNPTSLQLSGTF